MALVVFKEGVKEHKNDLSGTYIFQVDTGILDILGMQKSENTTSLHLKCLESCFFFVSLCLVTF